MLLKLRAPGVWQKRMGQLRETKEGLSRESGLKFWWEVGGGRWGAPERLEAGSSWVFGEGQYGDPPGMAGPGMVASLVARDQLEVSGRGRASSEESERGSGVR